MDHIHPVFYEKCRNSRQWAAANHTNIALWGVSGAAAVLFLFQMAVVQLSLQFPESYCWLAFVLVWLSGRLAWQVICEAFFWGMAPQE